MIQFDQIPSSIRKPGKYFEFNTKLAVRTLPQNRQRLLIIGPLLATAQVAEKIPYDVYSDTDAAAYFGAGSILHLMAKAAIKANPYVALTGIGLADSVGGVAAAGSITVDGAATASGTLTLWVGYQYLEVLITTAATANAIATAINAAINAAYGLPVTSTVSGAVVTVTAQNKGTVGNGISLAVDVTNFCVSTTVAQLSTGSGDPDIQDALDAVFSTQYHIYATPWGNQTSLGILKTQLDTISNAIEQKPGIGVYGFNLTLSGATTLAGEINSGRICCAYLRGTRSIPGEVAAAFAATMAFEEDPARPLNTLELTGIHAPAIVSRLSRTEQETCLYNGVTPIEVGPDGVPQIVRAITTYTVDADNIADISMLDVTTIRTLDYVRKACRERIALRFPREKLNDATIKSVRSELFDVLYRLQELQIVENVDVNKDGLVVERNGQDPNRIDAKIPTDVVNGLHVFAGRIDLIL
jgi:phage tail sheath gpL-like